MLSTLGFGKRYFLCAIVALCFALSGTAKADRLRFGEQRWLNIVQANTLWKVDPETGAFTQLGPTGAWTGATSFAGDTLLQVHFIIQGGKIWNVGVWSGTYSILNGEGWGGPTLSAIDFVSLYVVQAGYLWHVDVSSSQHNGSYRQVGGRAWIGATSMAYQYDTDTDDHLYIIQAGSLWRANENTGAYARLGPAGAWTGSTRMSSGSECDDRPGNLYVIQDGVVWDVRTSDGAYFPLNTENWAGATSMRCFNDYLYIVWGEHLYRMDPILGTYTVLGGANWGGPTLMSAYDYIP